MKLAFPVPPSPTRTSLKVGTCCSAIVVYRRLKEGKPESFKSNLNARQEGRNRQSNARQTMRMGGVGNMKDEGKEKTE